MVNSTACDCRACGELVEECGDELLNFYRRKLLIRGWAGVMSQAERTYVRAHRSEASRKQAEASARRLRNRHAEAAKLYRQTAEEAADGEIHVPGQAA